MAEEKKFSLRGVPNIVIMIVMVLAFAVIVLLNRNVGYVAFTQQQLRIDTLENECRILRERISEDSAIIASFSDSALFDRMLHEKLLFAGEGETVYEITE